MRNSKEILQEINNTLYNAGYDEAYVQVYRNGNFVLPLRDEFGENVTISRERGNKLRIRKQYVENKQVVVQEVVFPLDVLWLIDQYKEALEKEKQEQETPIENKE